MGGVHGLGAAEKARADSTSVAGRPLETGSALQNLHAGKAATARSYDARMENPLLPAAARAGRVPGVRTHRREQEMEARARQWRSSAGGDDEQKEQATDSKTAHVGGDEDAEELR